MEDMERLALERNINGKGFENGYLDLITQELANRGPEKSEKQLK